LDFFRKPSLPAAALYGDERRSRFTAQAVPAVEIQARVTLTAPLRPSYFVEG